LVGVGHFFGLGFQCFEIGLLLLVGFDCLTLFAVLIEFELKLRSALFHLLMAAGSGVG
jgi:hypothetical protein